MSRIWLIPGMFAAISLMGCVSPPPAFELRTVERRVADLPVSPIGVQLTASGFVIDGRAVTFRELCRELTQVPGRSVYCETTDKLTPVPPEQLEEMASATIRSGGRFFYRQVASSIDSLVYCTEFVASH